MDSTVQHKVDKVDQEIDSITQVLSQTPDDDPNMRLLLVCLANAHKKRAHLLKEPGDIQKVIEWVSIILTLSPDDSPDIPFLLSSIGTAHYDRFEQLGDMDDLNQSIEYQSLALELLPVDHPDLPHQLCNLATSQLDRFRRLSDSGDIDKAIEYIYRAMTRTPEADPTFPTRLEELGAALEYQSRVLALTHDDHASVSSLLAVSHNNRYHHRGDLSDIERAVEFGSRTIALTSDDDPLLSGWLATLAASHRHRFKRVGDLSDLDQAIKYGTRALALAPDDQACISLLLLCHIDRSIRLGDSDYEQALKYMKRALSFTFRNHPDLLSQLTNLSVFDNSRPVDLSELDDLAQAIDRQFFSFDWTPHKHLHSASHNGRPRHRVDTSDVERILEFTYHAQALTPDNLSYVPNDLAGQAMVHHFRFERLGILEELEKAIECRSRALAEITDDHPNSCHWHLSQALSYVDYYECSQNPSHLQESLLHFRAASITPAGPPRDKFKYAREWVLQALKHNNLNIIEAYQTTIDLLPQFIWLGATTKQRYQDLKATETLAVDAAHAAILSSDYSLALEWLEHTRCVVSSQNFMLRSPLDRLHSAYPSLATHLQTVAEQLHTASSNPRVSQALLISTDSEQAAQQHRRLAKDYEDLMAKARAQPGFENFLRPMKATELLRATRNGPIAVIHCHQDACNALLLLPNQDAVHCLPLPGFTANEARDARSKIISSLGLQGIRERGFHKLRQQEAKDEFASVLKMLWITVAKPILDFIGYTTQASADQLPHITWCPTGLASFLPLHAAGNYDEPRERVFDYVVSSYTPTLTALFSSAPSTLDCDSRVLAIGQAATPGCSPLPGTTAELKLVRSHVENKAGYSELLDAQATTSTVLDAMESHDWVHLACHAHQNVYDPTKSGVFLHNGTLDLASINRRSFKSKGLAYLSACQTATGDETLPDEAVHLASGMLMAGYSSVIATMWSVGDTEAPVVADKVYSQLMVEGKLGNGEAGRALHHAVARLREKIGEQEFGRWVPFIHIGS